MAFVFGALWDRSNLSGLNALSKSVEEQGKSIINLVGRHQLTPYQFSELLKAVNRNVQTGELSVHDINKNKGKIDQSFLTIELLQQISGNAPINAVPADGSLVAQQFATDSVTLSKIYNPYGILPVGTVFITEQTNVTRAISHPVFLNAGDKIVIASEGISMSVYYRYDEEIIPTHTNGWVKEFTAEESRNHTIRARFDNDSVVRDKIEQISSHIYVDNENTALKKKEFTETFNHQIIEYQNIPELNLVNGVISGVDGTLQAVQMDRVAVVHLQLKKGESIRLKNTTNYEMAMWIEGSNTYADGWRSTGYEAATDTIISFMIQKKVAEQVNVDEAREQIEYISGNEFARKADLFNIESGSNSNNMLYPSYPVWGHEYLYSWYDKLRNNQAVKMTWAGDSTTNNSDMPEEYRRHSLGKKLMMLGGYDEALVTTINAGHGSQHTGNWLGGDKDEDKRSPNGFLDEDMQGNPDLYVFSYGFNDGSNSHFGGLSWQERIYRFEENLIEGLERIRGSKYNKSPEDMAIILCTPIAAYDSGRGNTPPVWNDKIRPIIQKACRDYNCAFVDITARQYDHEFSSSWSTNGDMVHPTATANVDYMSMFEPLIMPRLLHK